MVVVILSVGHLSPASFHLLPIDLIVGLGISVLVGQIDAIRAALEVLIAGVL